MPEVTIVEVLERELDRLRGPHLIEWAHEVKLPSPAHLKLVEGYLVYHFSNWSGKILLELRVEDEKGKVYFDKQYRLLSSTLRTVLGRGRDSKKIEIPLSVKTSAPPVLWVRLRAEAVTGWFKFTITDLKLVIE